MSCQIPTPWRDTVIRLLRHGAPGQVLIRRRARQDWSDLFPDAFDWDLREAMADGLSADNVTGKRHRMDEPGETYAFIFSHRHRSIYGKINLTEPDHLVIIYSAHRPLQGEEL